MADTEHALLSASGSHKWMSCFGSLSLEQHHENVSSVYADEGTAAHEVFAKCLTSGESPHNLIGDRIDVGYRSFEVDTDMAGHVQWALDHTERLVAPGDTLLSERKVDYTSFLFPRGRPQLGYIEATAFGTADVLIVGGKTLTVADLKYGMGVRVDADENSQLMLYALGALSELELIYDFERVRLVVLQPRLNHYDEWECSIAELKEFALRASMAAEHAVALLGREPLVQDLSPGEEQCRFCRAKGSCPALRDHAFKTAAGVATIDEFEDLTATELSARVPLPGGLTPVELSKSFGAVELIEGWCKSIRAEAERRLLAGDEVPGLKLVEGKRGARKWTDADEAEKTLKAMRLKEAEMYDQTLISPTSAEKVLKSNPRKWAKLKPLIVQSDGKPHVAFASDPRPALDTTPRIEEFSDETGGDLV